MTLTDEEQNKMNETYAKSIAELASPVVAAINENKTTKEIAAALSVAIGRGIHFGFKDGQNFERMSPGDTHPVFN